jgi:hypothetical protein
VFSQGLASIAINREGLNLRNVTRLEDTDDILRWIKSEAGGGSAVVGVDAPLVIRNRTGIREAERELNREFRRYHAANLGRPFARNVLSFSRKLTDLGFCHGADIRARQGGRFQIEVHPHAATVNLFDLPRIVKYKRGDSCQCFLGSPLTGKPVPAVRLSARLHRCYVDPHTKPGQMGQFHRLAGSPGPFAITPATASPASLRPVFQNGAWSDAIAPNRGDDRWS